MTLFTEVLFAVNLQIIEITCFIHTHLFSQYRKILFEKINLLSVLFFLKARFLLSKVNPSQTHNNMYAWGQVSMNLLMKLVHVISPPPLFQKANGTLYNNNK